MLEAMSDAEWQVAGLKIGITPQTRINGEPEVGAQVSGTVQAPGDGTLIALELNVQSTRRQGAAPVATDTPTPTATSQPPTLTPTATQAPATPTNERPAIMLATETTSTHKYADSHVHGDIGSHGYPHAHAKPHRGSIADPAAPDAAERTQARHGRPDRRLRLDHQRGRHGLAGAG